MKKLFTALFLSLVIFTLSACNSDGGNNNTGNNNSPSSGNKDYSSSASAKDNTVSAKITSDEAISKALEDAGLKKDEVKFLRSELDRDDGILKYEVEFTKDGIEYEYDINADTGEILWVDKDAD